MKFTTEESKCGTGYLKTGIFNARVLGINPTASELNKILGKEAKEGDKEPEYLYTKDEKDHVRIVFWVEDVLSKWKTKIEFDIINEEASTKSGNPIWINQLGDNAKVTKENLQKWFIEFHKSKEDKTIIGEKNYKRALVNEAQLYEFMRAWMSGKSTTNQKINWYAPTTDIFLDRKKLFRGNVSELTDQLKASEEENITTTVVCAAWVDSYDKDGEIKHAQKVWLYKFVPGYLMSKINLCMQSDSWDSSADTKKIKDALVGEYGIKKGFRLQSLAPFDPNEHMEAGTETIRHSDSAAPTDTEW